jgi:hypothetical protein
MRQSVTEGEPDALGIATVNGSVTCRPQITDERMKHSWIRIDMGKPKYLEKNLTQWHFVHYKSHIACRDTEPGPQR